VKSFPHGRKKTQPRATSKWKKEPAPSPPSWSKELSSRTSPVKILDLACGTGAVVKEIYDAVPREKWPEVNILAGDTSDPMLEFLHERAEMQGWSGVETRKVDGGVCKVHLNSICCAWYNMLTDKPRRTCNSQPQATRTSSSTSASS
jgi:SAM-dependent methyltransferase